MYFIYSLNSPVKPESPSSTAPLLPSTISSTNHYPRANADRGTLRRSTRMLSTAPSSAAPTHHNTNKPPTPSTTSKRTRASPLVAKNNNAAAIATTPLSGGEPSVASLMARLGSVATSTNASLHEGVTALIEKEAAQSEALRSFYEALERQRREQSTRLLRMAAKGKGVGGRSTTMTTSTQQQQKQSLSNAHSPNATPAGGTLGTAASGESRGASSAMGGRGRGGGSGLHTPLDLSIDVPSNTNSRRGSDVSALSDAAPSTLLSRASGRKLSPQSSSLMPGGHRGTMNKKGVGGSSSSGLTSDGATLAKGVTAIRRDHSTLLFAQYDALHEGEMKGALNEALLQLKVLEGDVLPRIEEQISNRRANALAVAERTVNTLAAKMREAEEEEGSVDAAIWEAEMVLALLAAQSRTMGNVISRRSRITETGLEELLAREAVEERRQEAIASDAAAAVLRTVGNF